MPSHHQWSGMPPLETGLLLGVTMIRRDYETLLIICPASAGVGKKEHRQAGMTYDGGRLDTATWNTLLWTTCKRRTGAIETT